MRSPSYTVRHYTAEHKSDFTIDVNFFCLHLSSHDGGHTFNNGCNGNTIMLYNKMKI